MAKRNLTPNPRLEEVDIELIDEPDLAARDTMDPEALADLVESIRDNGLIHPIVLEETGARYRIEAGHRRFIAFTILERKTIPATIWKAGTLNRESTKLHENLYREDLNVAEEAQFLMVLLERDCGGDVDRLCEKVKQKRGYVESRLTLLKGDPAVLDAVKRRVLGWSVARVLNEVKDDSYRAMYLDAAIRGGATVATVRGWKDQANGITPQEPPEFPPLAGAALPNPDLQHKFECICCKSDEEHYDMELVYVHRSCKRRFLDPLLVRVFGEVASDGLPIPADQ